jgi:hypothetical protein
MNHSEPLFKQVFGKQWNELPVAIVKRYANHPYSNDVVTVQGKLTIYFSRLMTIFIPLLKLCRVLVPYQGKDIPAIVKFRSSENSPTIYLDRTVYFPHQKIYCFNSYVQVIDKSDVVEFTGSRFGWRMKCTYNNGKVLLQHQGFVCKIGSKLIPLPLGLLMGNIYAEEVATSPNSFRMLVKIIHPIFGKLYEYYGEFTILE